MRAARSASSAASNRSRTLGRLGGEIHESLLGAALGPRRLRLASLIAAVRTQLPCRRVRELRGQDVIEPAAARGIAAGRPGLDPRAQVPRAPVGGADVVLRLAAVGEIEDPGVLEESPEQA